jgi:translation elongation factor EF-1beta
LLTAFPLQSVVTLEVKPWDDETDMKKLEEAVRAVEMEGLVWGSSKLVPVGYGVSKLQITLVVGASRGAMTAGSPTHSPTEDELVSLVELQEKIAEMEDFVQSTDVAAMMSTFLAASTVHVLNLSSSRALIGDRFPSMASPFWVTCEVISHISSVCTIMRENPNVARCICFTDFHWSVF